MAYNETIGRTAVKRMVQLIKAPRAALSSLGEWTFWDVIKYAILAQSASVLVPVAVAGIYVLGEGRFLPVVESGPFALSAGDHARGILFFAQVIIIAIDLAMLLIWLIVATLNLMTKSITGKAQTAAAIVYGATPVIILSPWVLGLVYLQKLIPMAWWSVLFLALLFFLLGIHILAIILQIGGLRRTALISGGRTILIATVPIIGITALFILTTVIYAWVGLGLIWLG